MEEGHIVARPTATISADRLISSDRDNVSPWQADLRLLGRFDLTVDHRSVPLGATSQRLLALVAIRSGQIPRVQAAGNLWPDTRAPRAAANLRSVLWRLQQCCCGILDASFYDLRLAPHVRVDIHHVSRVAFELLDGSASMSADQLKNAMRCNLYDDIAADIGDVDWLACERERFRQLRVHALEALASKLIAAGWYGAAVEAALGAVRADPFRERAYQLLIGAHLAEGSRLEAYRQHRAYRELLQRELGLEPSDEFMNLLHDNRST
ncbi:MAG TPA: BTAD domain-containing putative transcriptional regulator [Pseudonocardiaceae bacterium]|nr:BTAD domain-containing putative transcriptional regulator [Pseudonocardiaceae bacterium]